MNYSEIKTASVSASGQSGFVMLLVLMTSVAFSIFAATQISDSGASLTGSQFAQRAVGRMDATRTAAVFCAQIGTRHYSGAVSLTTSWTSDDVFYDLINVSNIKNSLVTSVQDGLSVADTVVSTNSAARIRLGRRPDGTYDPVAMSWFIDPDFVGSYTYNGSGAFFGGLTDCAGGGGGGYYCGGAASTVFTMTGEQVNASTDSNEYNLLPCEVRVQMNKYVKADGTLDTAKPYQTYMVSFRHDYKRPTGDKL